MHLIIERASRYPRVPLIRNSIFAQNVPFSQTRSHIYTVAMADGVVLESTVRGFHVSKSPPPVRTARKPQGSQDVESSAKLSATSYLLGGKYRPPRIIHLSRDVVDVDVADRAHSIYTCFQAETTIIVSSNSESDTEDVRSRKVYTRRR